MMNEIIEIEWTSANLDEARKISRYLVQERIVASAQITPWIESIYNWDNQLETVQESKITLKTLLSHFEKVEEIIKKNSSYQVPEITYKSLKGGNQEYSDWIVGSVFPLS